MKTKRVAEGAFCAAGRSTTIVIARAVRIASTTFLMTVTTASVFVWLFPHPSLKSKSDLTGFIVTRVNQNSCVDNNASREKFR